MLCSPSALHCMLRDDCASYIGAVVPGSVGRVQELDTPHLYVSNAWASLAIISYYIPTSVQTCCR